MSQDASVWFVVLVGFSATNLPSVSSRVMGMRTPARSKTLATRLLELVVLYILAGGLGLLLELQAGQIAPQSWKFHAITATLFLTFVFPGFVYRYLLKHRE